MTSQAATTAALRIVQAVRSDAFAGVERYIATVSRELAERGCKVVVVGGDADRMETVLDGLPIPHFPAASTAAVWRALTRLAQPDIVHAHMTAAGAAAVLARPMNRAPILLTRHFPSARARSVAGRIAAKAIDRGTAGQIAISDFVASRIGVPSTTIANGVPVAAESARRLPVVLMAQRLEPEKNVALGLRAWALSDLAALGWRLVIAGDGCLRAELEGLARRLGCGCSVEFIGNQSDLDALLDDASVFLSTARAEPFGLSVVEAMARGVPVVAAASRGHLETVGRCSTRWLFPPEDASACAERLRTLCLDPAAQRDYGRAVQACQRAHYSLSAHVDRLLELYDAALNHLTPKNAR